MLLADWDFFLQPDVLSETECASDDELRELVESFSLGHSSVGSDDELQPIRAAAQQSEPNNRRPSTEATEPGREASLQQMWPVQLREPRPATAAEQLAKHRTKGRKMPPRAKQEIRQKAIAAREPPFALSKS